VVFLCACSSTYSLQGAFTYEEINRKLNGEQATIELKAGKEIHSQRVRITHDSVAWLDQSTGEESTLSMKQLNTIVIIKKSHFLGGLEGLVLGAIGGAGIGWLMTDRREYGEGLLLYNIIVQGGIWAGAGLITGAIIGHTEYYEVGNIRIGALPTRADVLYLKNGGSVRGTIIAEVREGNSLLRVTIRNANGEIRTYQTSEIDRIAKGD